MHEDKKVRLGDHPFLVALTTHGSTYQGYSLYHEITVSAAVGRAGDWAAYFQAPWTPFGAAAVHEHGNKLPEKVACDLFPEWAKKYKWRP